MFPSGITLHWVGMLILRYKDVMNVDRLCSLQMNDVCFMQGKRLCCTE